MSTAAVPMYEGEIVAIVLLSIMVVACVAYLVYSWRKKNSKFDEKYPFLMMITYGAAIFGGIVSFILDVYTIDKRLKRYG